MRTTFRYSPESKEMKKLTLNVQSSLVRSEVEVGAGWHERRLLLRVPRLLLPSQHHIAFVSHGM